MARQEVSRTTHIEEGELRVTHENAILTNITVGEPQFFGKNWIIALVGTLMDLCVVNIATNLQKKIVI